MVVAKTSDFAHLWTGGHVVGLDPAGMYDPAAQRPFVDELSQRATFPLWSERADRVGVFFYPPTAAVWYGLLGLLDYKAAAAVQGLVTLACVGVSAVCVAALSERRLAPATVGVIILASPTCLYAYALGQNGVMTLAVASAAALALARDRDGLAGSLLALLTCKPSWTLGLAWLPLALKRWRAVGALLGAGLGGAAAAAVVFGPHRFVEYIRVAGLVARLDRLPNYPLDFQHNLFALTRGVFGIGGVTDLVATALGVTVVAFTAWRFGGAKALSLEAAGAFFAAGTLANPHVHHYDMLPMCVAVAAVVAAFPTTWTGRVLAIGLIAFWYAAFFLGETLALGVSIPAVANLAVWAWLVRR